ncbi:MAG: Mrp/NBP35 family ATP-binding protein [Deltaproteobacteria bacterium]|nr:Mrp/NBP35 family ATP-binding protein [Deltaproteobacteria bacterium]
MRQIVAVVSGKGGVGKSTVAVNLAVAMAATGRKVALVDADFYGPSVPTLLGAGAIEATQDGKMIPVEKYGVKLLSVGLFLEDPDTPVIWRGPMFHKAMQQIFEETQWGDVDYCIVDMPPGTGDAPLSLTQLVKLTGALVVTTPQEVAMADVRKSINMLRKVGVDLLGIVENMAGFVTPDGVRHDIFGSGGGATISKSFGIPLLCSIPLESSIRESGDMGKPAALEQGSVAAELFEELALKVIDILATKPKDVPSLRIVKE